MKKKKTCIHLQSEEIITEINKFHLIGIYQFYKEGTDFMIIEQNKRIIHVKFSTKNENIARNRRKCLSE